MWGRQRPGREARKYAQSITRHWIKGDVPRAITSLDEPPPDVLTGALAGLLKAAATSPQAVRTLEIRADGSGDTELRLQRCLQFIATDPATWGEAPEAFEVKMSVMDVSSALAHQQGMESLDDLPDDAFAWGAGDP